MENSKDKIDSIYKRGDLLNKQADILNKKALLLLASNGGIATIFIKIDLNKIIENSLMGIFTIFTIGLIAIYIKISKINEKLEKLNSEIERIENG